MKYISTRGQSPALTFEEAMLSGLARDGGLYVPEEWPMLTQDQIAGFAGQSYEQVAYAVMKPFVGDTFTDIEFMEIIQKAYAGFAHTARCPLVQLDENHFLLELFHGPTLA
ncbi:MAG: threonine synthase, partial [Proteobacteria bacterium]|nr:threonine synthase [Pseudomonadota bacterium]